MYWIASPVGLLTVSVPNSRFEDDSSEDKANNESSPAKQRMAVSLDIGQTRAISDMSLTCISRRAISMDEVAPTAPLR